MCGCKASIGILLASVVVTVGCAAQPGTVSRTLPADLVEVKVLRTEIDAETEAQKVLLQEKAGMRTVTIFIGLAEAYAIQRALDGEEPARPMTHDLATNLISALGGQLDRVVIELHGREGEQVFVATLVVRQGLSTRLVDARASDALALALRTESPIVVVGGLLQ